MKKYFNLLKVSLVLALLFGSVYFSQDVMAGNCCKLGYLIPPQYYYFRDFMVGNNEVVTATATYTPYGGSSSYMMGTSTNWSSWDIAKDATYGTGPYQFEWSHRVLVDSSGNSYIQNRDIITKYDTSLNVVSTLTISGFDFSTYQYSKFTDVANDKLYMLATKIPNDGQIYVISVDLPTMAMNGSPVAIMPQSALVHQGAMTGVRYSEFDNSINIVSSPTTVNYGLEKYIVDFNSGTSTWQNTKSINLSTGFNYYYNIADFNYLPSGELIISGSKADSSGEYVTVINPDGTKSSKTDDFKNTYANAINVTNDRIYLSSGDLTSVYTTGLNLIADGIASTGDMVVTQDVEYTYTLKLSKKPVGSIMVNVQGVSGSNFVFFKDIPSGYLPSINVSLDETNWNTGVNVKFKYIGDVNEYTNEGITHSIVPSGTTSLEPCVLGLLSNVSVNKKNALIDPPYGEKVVTPTGPILKWGFFWINQDTVGTAPVHFMATDTIPSGVTYISGSLVCRAAGATVSSSCYYDTVQNRVVWIGDIAADGAGVVTMADANNEIEVSYNTTYPTGTVTNQASGYVDSDLDGDVDLMDIETVTDYKLSAPNGDPTPFVSPVISAVDDTLPGVTNDKTQFVIPVSSLLGNDSYNFLNNLTISNILGATSVVYDSVTGNVTVTIPNGFVGNVSFDYQLTDANTLNDTGKAVLGVSSVATPITPPTTPVNPTLPKTGGTVGLLPRLLLKLVNGK